MEPKDMEMKDQDDEVKDLPTTIPCPGTIEVDYDRDHALATTLQEQERAFAMLESTESDEDEYEDEDGDGDGDGDESYLPSTDEYFEGGFQFYTSQELADLELLEEEDEEEDEEDEHEEEEEDEELEEEDINTEDEEEEEDELDTDDLTYEDLVALGEIAGEENQGLTPEEIIPCLSPYTCVSINSNTGIDKCVICQVEYEEGEGLVALRCAHPFHDACINQWLQIKKICPICCKEAIKQKTE